jgi:hypothetical protein
MRFGRNIRVEGRIGFAGYNGALFYAVIGASTLLGIGMVFVKINPVKALFWASTIMVSLRHFF